MRTKFKTILLYGILSIVCTNCALYMENRITTPDELQCFKQDILDVLNDSAKYNFSDYYLTKVIVRKDNTGIYSFTDRSIHHSYYDVFMYDGTTITFTNLEDSVGMRQFLEKNNFSKFEIIKWKKRVKLLNKDAEATHKATFW